MNEWRAGEVWIKATICVLWEICISLDTYACSIDTALPCNRSTLHFGIFALFTVPRDFWLIVYC